MWLHQVLTNYHKGFLCGDFLSEVQNFALGVGISQSEAMKAGEYVAADKDRKFLAAEAYGKGEESSDGVSAVNVESSLDAEATESTEDGSF